MFSLRGRALDVVHGPGVPLLVLTEDEVHVVDGDGRATQVLPDAEDDVDTGPWPVEWPLRVGYEPFGDSQPVLVMYEIAQRSTPRRVLLSTTDEPAGSFFVPVVNDRQGDSHAAYVVSTTPDRPVGLMRYALDGSGALEISFDGGADAVEIDVRARRAYVQERAGHRGMTWLGLPLGIIPLGGGAGALTRLDELMREASGLPKDELAAWAARQR